MLLLDAYETTGRHASQWRAANSSETRKPVHFDRLSCGSRRRFCTGRVIAGPLSLPERHLICLLRLLIRACASFHSAAHCHYERVPEPSHTFRVLWTIHLHEARENRAAETCTETVLDVGQDHRNGRGRSSTRDARRAFARLTPPPAQTDERVARAGSWHATRAAATRHEQARTTTKMFRRGSSKVASPKPKSKKNEENRSPQKVKSLEKNTAPAPRPADGGGRRRAR